MGARDKVLARIDEIEVELHDLGSEVQELRAQVVAAAAEAVARPAAPVHVAMPPRPAPARPATVAREWEEAMLSARIQLSKGRQSVALDELERAVTIAQGRSDREALSRLAAELQGIARYRPAVRTRALELARRAGLEAARATPSSDAPREASAPAQPAPRPPRRGGRELAREWDLLGPRGFAIVGGTVTALGIILLFVLASNRGWITPAARVAIGAAAAGLAVAAGIWVRRCYGQMQVALGAAGAGIAGAYACLAAAAARYDLVPDWLALPLAGIIAAVATGIALAWSSQIVAAIGLVGAGLAPALQALDTGMTWVSAAFALIVLAAAVAVSVPTRWRHLLVAVALVVTGQVLWLVAGEELPAESGTVCVAAALVLMVLAAAVAWQLTCTTTDLDALAASFSVAAVALALQLSPVLYASGRDRGIALAVAAAVWTVAWAGLRRRQPSLGLVLAVSVLTLAGVAVADAFSGTVLSLTWAAQSLLFTALAWRLRDVRLQLAALAYAGLAAVHAIAFVAPLRLLTVDPVDAALAVPLAAVAAAIAAAGLFAPVQAEPRTESGLLAWIAPLREWLSKSRDALRALLLFGAAAAGTYAAAFALVGTSYRQGHLATVALAGAVGAACAGANARLRCDVLVAASLGWLAVVVRVAAAFDVPEFANAAANRSYGGWALIAAAASVLAGGMLVQLLYPDRPQALTLVPGITGVVSLVVVVAGLRLLAPPGDVLATDWLGWRLLLPTAAYVVLAACVFRVPQQRDLATILWALGTAAILGAEWLVLDDLVWRSVAFAVTATFLAGLARPLREARLWTAGWGLGLATALGTVAVLAERWSVEGAEPRRYALAALSASVSLVWVSFLSWRDPGRRNLVELAWAAGLVALLVGEAFLVGGGRLAACLFALTGGAVALLAALLSDRRLWWAGAIVTGATTAAVIVTIVPPAQFLLASESPADGLWVLVGCVAGATAVGLGAPLWRRELLLCTAAVALYGLSLAILELGEWTFGGSVQSDFERGHVGVSIFWALVGLALLVAGLARGWSAARYVGLALFGLSLAKIFLYDLSALNSAARALSFIMVGALVLAGGFFLQRLSAQIGPRRPQVP